MKKNSESEGIILKSSLSTSTWLLLVTLFALVLTTFTLSYIVTAPWHEMPELGADGGKNIYTYLYHVLYGKGVWFDGMNYPYGEHIVYTDGQPLLSVPLSYLSRRVTMGTALTIMWWMVALSYVLSIIYCFKILIRFKVAPLIAMCFAGLITIFSPQLFRISGHYALSVVCILPMLFYWSLRYYNKEGYKYLLFIFILGTLATFLHPYYAAVSLVWAGCYIVGYLLTQKESMVAKLKHTLPLLLSVIAVFAVFGTVMKFTDPATDRPTTPYGILSNCTGIKDVISNSNSPVWAFIKHLTKVDGITEGGEGRAYVGLVVLMAVGIALVLGLRNKYILKKSSLSQPEKGFHPIWLIMAVMALLFGMGAPFTWGMEWLLDYASMLKQFRTLGRFSWICYYIITIYGSVVIYNWYAALIVANKKAAANTLLFAALALWSFEASGYIARTHKKLEIGYHAYDTFVSTGQTNWEQFLHQHNYKKEDFQATLVLPFFEVGSEKLWVGNDENISALAIAMGIQAGIQLHLPMIDGMMSRTSWEVAFKQVKIVGGPYADKTDFLKMGFDKNLLIIVLNNVEISPDEKFLLDRADYLGDFQNCKIYSNPPRRIWDNQRKIVFGHRGNTNTCVNTGEPDIFDKLPASDTCIKYTGDWFVEHFDNIKTANALVGGGALSYAENMNPVLAKYQLNPGIDAQLYEFSCWFLVPSNDYRSPVVTIDILDSAGKVLTSKKALAKESTDNFEMWLRCNTYFGMPLNARTVKCTVDDIGSNTFITADELLIKPADAVIVTKLPRNKFLINNHIIQFVPKLK